MPSAARFCPSCGRAVADAGEAPSERRLVSIVFADLSGFTSYAEATDVENAQQVAASATAELSRLVERFGGTVDNVIGDCVMGVFGVPVAHEDDAERAVRCALAMQERAAEGGHVFGGLPLSIGVNTGEVVWSMVAATGRRTVVGDAVNTAARLQALARPTEVVVGEQTRRSAPSIECERLAPAVVKNKAEPVAAWRAIAYRPQATARPILTPFVGRSHERELLERTWQEVALDAQARTVLISGPAGIGKSRLVTELLAAIGPSVPVLRSGCLSYGAGMALWPVSELLRQATGLRHDDPPGTVAARTDALLDGLVDEGPVRRMMAQATAMLLGEPAPSGTDHLTTSELHAAVAEVMRRLARRGGLVVVVEDLHFSEPGLLDLLAEIAKRSDAPLLTVMTSRESAGERHDRLARSIDLVIDLDPLAADDMRAIIESLGGREIGGLDAALRAAGGNPLFAQEVILMWLAEPAAEPQRRVPPSLQALVESRLDQLSASARAVLGAAAVVGDRVWRGAIASMSNEPDLDGALRSLVAAGYMRPSDGPTAVTGETELTFAHGLIRDAAYARLTKRERGTLHERCASWIEGLGGRDELTEILAHHLEQSCVVRSDLTTPAGDEVVRRAAGALLQASERAEARTGITDALAFVGRADAIVEDRIPHLAAEIAANRARLQFTAGAFDVALQGFRDLVARATALGDDLLLCKSLLCLVESSSVVPPPPDGEELVRRAEELAARLRSPSLVARAKLAKGLLTAATLGVVHAIPLLEEAERADRDSETGPTIHPVLTLATALFNARRIADARAPAERTMAVAEAKGSRRFVAWSQYLLGHIDRHLGPRTDVEHRVQEALAWLDGAGDAYVRVQALLLLAEHRLSEGDLEGALVTLESMRDLDAVGDDDRLHTRVTSLLAEILTCLGRRDEVRRLDRRTAAGATDTDEIAALKLDAFMAAANGARDEADRFVDDAIARCERSHRATDLADLLLSFARLRAIDGDADGAAALLARAVEEYRACQAEASADVAARDHVVHHSLQRSR